MAKYWARSGFEIDMETPDLSDVVRGQGSTSNEHTLKISYGDGYATTIKGDFDLNGKGYAKGGTITRISFEDDDHYGTTVSGLRLDLDAFVKAAKSATLVDDAKLYAKMFAGSDEITGGSDDDFINGFGGDDDIIGGLGVDVLTGGTGADIFLYESRYDSDEGLGIDTIVDFSQADGDKISLRDAAFLDFETEVRISSRGTDTIIEVDTNGAFILPMIIRVQGNIALTEADFIL